MSKLPLARAPKTVELEAPCAPEHLHTTIEEHGFAQTVSSNSGDPRGLPTKLHWRAPTDDTGELTVRGLLGQGGMSSVLLVDQPALNREVAVKVPRTSEGAQLLVTEARLNGLVEHPGVIPVYALVSDDQNQPALVMRKVDATSWRALLEAPGHPLWKQLGGGDRLEAQVRILLQVCNTLAYAHTRGVIHRDLKPENVLIGTFGEIFLADWGVATRVSEQSPELLVGTAAYLAPEMARGEPVDERTDVFLVGSTLYEVLSGHAPWRGASIIAALREAVKGTPPALPSGAPRELVQLCRRAMAPRPQERFTSMLEVKHELEAWLSHRGSQRASDQAWKRAEALQQATSLKAGREKVYRLLSECRFGFQLALDEWPQNLAAEQGLERSVLLVAEYELAQGHPDAARALVAELKKPPAAIAQAIAALSDSQARSAAKLEAILTTADPKTGARRRMRIVVSVTAGLLAFVVAGLVAPDLFTHRWSLVFANMVFNSILGFTWFFSGVEPSRLSWLNRSALGSIVVMSLGALVFRSMAAAFEVPHLTTLSLELVALGLFGAGLGLALHRGFFAMAPLALLTVLVMVALGRAALELYSTGVAVMLGATAWAVRSGKTALLARADDAGRE
ncbi:MAG: serine/threonine-protein kinase [Myxococcaceae bacterium]|nr:serine/threonine-protein kinase [Myxococcaceae bacterium]